MTGPLFHSFQSKQFQSLRIVDQVSKPKTELSRDVVLEAAKAVQKDGLSKKEYQALLAKVKLEGVTPAERGFLSHLLSVQHNPNSKMVQKLGEYLAQSEKEPAKEYDDQFAFEKEDFDSNHDGDISERDALVNLELPQTTAPEAVVFQLSDDTLSLDTLNADLGPASPQFSQEVREFLQSQELPQHLSQADAEALDWNEDQVISKEEVFEALDQNRDGFVSADAEERQNYTRRVWSGYQENGSPSLRAGLSTKDRQNALQLKQLLDPTFRPETVPVPTPKPVPQGGRVAPIAVKPHEPNEKKIARPPAPLSQQAVAERVTTYLQSLSPTAFGRLMESLSSESKTELMGVLSAADSEFNWVSQNHDAPCSAENPYMGQLVDKLTQGTHPKTLHRFFSDMRPDSWGHFAESLSQMPEKQQMALFKAVGQGNPALGVRRLATLNCWMVARSNASSEAMPKALEQARHFAQALPGLGLPKSAHLQSLVQTAQEMPAQSRWLREIKTYLPRLGNVDAGVPLLHPPAGLNSIQFKADMHWLLNR